MTAAKIILKKPLRTAGSRTTTKYYWSDLEEVSKVIRAWAAGDPMSSPPINFPVTGENYHRFTNHERIRSRSDPLPLKRAWLTSSWVQIGVNIEGAKILVDYTIEHFDDWYLAADVTAKEEIINHIQLAKELYPDCAVWSPEAWRYFPLSESPRDLQFPF